jgi:hypothetical protein
VLRLKNMMLYMTITVPIQANVIGRSNVRAHPFVTYIFFTNIPLPDIKHGLGETEMKTYSQYVNRFSLKLEYKFNEYLPKQLLLVEIKREEKIQDLDVKYEYERRYGKKIKVKRPRWASSGIYSG